MMTGGITGDRVKCIWAGERAAVCLHVYDAWADLSADLGSQGEQAGATHMATVKVTPEMIDRAVGETDWAALDGLTDGEIVARAADDPDAAPVLTAAETAAAMVRTVRRQLGISQAAFAARYHILIGTLRDWEQARKHPDGPALAYLRVIAKEPAMTAKALAG